MIMFWEFSSVILESATKDTRGYIKSENMIYVSDRQLFTSSLCIQLGGYAHKVGQLFKMRSS